MTLPISFLHLTDLHISAPERADQTLNGDTLAALDAAISRIAEMDFTPAFVAISGDLTHRGDAESYRLLAGRLDRIAAPKVLALGNHDTRGAFRAVMLGQTGEAPHAHQAVIAGVHVIALDTLVPGRIGGALDAGQFDFLADALDAHPDLPKIVVMHHPPAVDPDSDLIWHSLTPADSARLAGMIAGRVAGVLCGHVHVPRVSHWHGVPVVVGNGLHDLIDPLTQDGMRIMDSTGFGLCTLRPSGLTVEFVPLPHRGQEVGRLSAAVVRDFR